MRTASASLSIVFLAGIGLAAGVSQYIQPLGSASLATNEIMRSCAIDRVVDIPDDCNGITVTYWAATRNCTTGSPNNDWALPTGVGSGGYQPPHATDFLPMIWYTPDHQDGGPDILGGAWGWGGSAITVSGSRTLSYNFPTITDGWNGGTNGVASFPHGVYCVRWSDVSAPMTVTVGGEDVTITSGSGEKNVNPKDGIPGIVLVGSGTAKIGISRLKIHEFCGTMFGDNAWDDPNLVGSNYVFVAHRIGLTSNLHTGRTDIATLDGSWRRRGQAFDPPVDGSTYIHAHTFARIAYYAIGRSDLSYVYEWDFRQFPKFLDDDEIQGIYEDGVRIRTQFHYDPVVSSNAVHQVDP